jgi:hypothetical protein
MHILGLEPLGDIPVAERKVPVPLPNGATGQADEIFPRESKEGWNEYLLEDGTVIRAKLAVISFLRVDGEYDPEGNPLYAMKATSTHVITSVPEELRKKVQ